MPRQDGLRLVSLRRGEINALHWGDLHLDVANPFCVVPVAKSKSRKEPPHPLHPELATELQAMKSAGKLAPETLVFPERVPAMKVIRTDFKTAGIPLEDERGHPWAANLLPCPGLCSFVPTATNCRDRRKKACAIRFSVRITFVVPLAKAKLHRGSLRRRQSGLSRHE